MSILDRLRRVVRALVGKEHAPERLYLVFGNSKLDDVISKRPTNPASFGLDVHDLLSISRDVPLRVHAYPDVSVAVQAMYRCGLEPYGSLLHVYRRVGVEWTFDKAETVRVIEETPW